MTDLQASFSGQQTFPYLGASITFVADGVVTMNLSGELAPAPVPIGPATGVVLAAALGAAGARAARTRRHAA